MNPLFAPMLVALWAPLGEALAADVRIATSEWAPYADSEAEGGGILIGLVQQRLEARGHTVTVDVLPWQRALMETRKGRYDVVFPLYRTPAREREYRYSQPLVSTALAVYGRADAPPLGELTAEALRGKRIGVVRGYSNGPLIDGTEGLELDNADDDVSNLRKLLAGRVDLVVIDDLVARYTLATVLGHLDGAEQVGVLREQTLYAAVSLESDPAIVELLDALFAEAARDGTLAAISERYGLPVVASEPTGAPESESP